MAFEAQPVAMAYFKRGFVVDGFSVEKDWVAFAKRFDEEGFAFLADATQGELAAVGGDSAERYGKVRAMGDVATGAVADRKLEAWLE